jgi:hypothetical protein
MKLPRMVDEALDLWRELGDAGKTIAALLPAWQAECLGQSCRTPSLDPLPHAGPVMAILAKRARKTVPEAPQCALNWANFGSEAGQPRLGDVLCGMREGGAYVGIYIGEDDVAYHLIGADEADGISVTRLPKERLYAARRPIYEGGHCVANGIRLNRDGSLAQ